MPRDNAVSSAPIAPNADGVYAGRKNNQHAALFERLRDRRLTVRKVLLYAAAVSLLIFAEPATATFIAGTMLVLLGCMVRIWTFGHLQKNQMLVTTGPYAYSRNPAYFGSALVLTGMVIAAGNPDSTAGIALWSAGLLGITVFFLVYLPRKYDREYARLAALFPGEYERHAAAVPGFFPRLTPWRSGDVRRFSWACLQANHELIWTTTSVLALGLMWLG